MPAAAGMRVKGSSYGMPVLTEGQQAPTGMDSMFFPARAGVVSVPCASSHQPLFQLLKLLLSLLISDSSISPPSSFCGQGINRLHLFVQPPRQP